MKIKEISPENRPRERLKREGIEVLSDAEILAIILQKGSREENVIDMSNRLISMYGLGKLSGCSLQELQQIKGIGEAKAMQILAAFELQKRTKNIFLFKKKIRTSQDVIEQYAHKIKEKKKENCIVVFLDIHRNIIGDELVSIGTLDSSVIHPREVFKGAIKSSAHSIIFLHNHPSGDPTPSPEDMMIKNLIEKAGLTIGIELLDFIIIGSNSNFFLRQEYA